MKKYRLQKDAKSVVFHGQCNQKVWNHHWKPIRCPNEGQERRHGMCEACYIWNLKQAGIYPHKDNDTKLTEVYLIL